uniref:Uncharacterized protein n=1 Tax=Meloidogyne javanica TaxID=6303 RepID=A0A915MCA7_MELJA
MDFGLIKQPTTGGLSSTSPRMRRFAERLAVIQISLDPPSPPEFALQSPDENSGRAPVPFWAQPGYENYFRPIEDSLLLQVPRVLDQDDADPMRECSPPPRRCSYASTGQDENHRSKRVSVCHCNCQQLLIQQKRQQRQRRSHSAV